MHENPCFPHPCWQTDDDTDPFSHAAQSLVKGQLSLRMTRRSQRLMTHRGEKHLCPPEPWEATPWQHWASTPAQWPQDALCTARGSGQFCALFAAVRMHTQKGKLRHPWSKKALDLQQEKGLLGRWRKKSDAGIGQGLLVTWALDNRRQTRFKSGCGDSSFWSMCLC